MPDYPETLSKFCTAATAVTILSSHNLRWSSPHLFNDPFELDHRTGLSFDPKSLLDEVIRTTIAMIFSPYTPQGNSPLITGIRRWRDDERFSSPSDAEASAALLELLSKMVDLRMADVDAIMADWRRFTRHQRICCFSAKPDNLNCWLRFADNHRGAAIRFHSEDLIGNMPDEQLAYPVEYKNIRPEIITPKEQLTAVIHNVRFDEQQLFLEKLLTKSLIVRNEQEWRCFYYAANETSSKHNNDREWFDDRSFVTKAVSAIYLGAYMPGEDKKNLLDIQKELYPDAKIFQAQPVPGKYEIEFIRLSR